MAANPSIRLNQLAFVNRTGGARAELPFSDSFSFVFGASNTGKSFAVKSLDFMLGGNRELPDIIERRPYERAILELSLSSGERLSLERALAGGDFSVSINGAESVVFSARHNRNDEANLSNYLLNRLKMADKEVAKDKSGTKKALSFRDIVRLCIVDETAIQSETSPAESGEIQFAALERNIFKYMLTGVDDAAMITQLKPKDFSTGRNAQVGLLEGMLAEVESEISDSFPDIDDLPDEYVAVQDELTELEKEMAFVRDSSREKLENKARLVVSINRDQQRVNDISMALENFEQLKRVYDSDIARLESIEEAGFLLGLNMDDACPVCGSPPEAHVHKHALSEIEAARAAAEIEIAKVKAHGIELSATLKDTSAELERSGQRLLLNQQSLTTLEEDLAAGSPKSADSLRRISEIIPRRDRINRGLALARRQVELTRQIADLKKKKQTRRHSNFQAGLSTQIANDFAVQVGLVLQEWGFPGECRTFFDTEGTFDLIIDGKRRRDNGKGVRAITHAAFKVALLIYCRSRGLPHPGLLVMDSPLITYRDPIQSKGGDLADDEEAIKSSDLRERMLSHLGSLGDLGQIVIFDNIDAPANVADFAQIEVFTNNPAEGRQGLL
ncbi:hypothetical protein [Sphingobium sp. EP60837]|uniref:hypothetical protein n=1 Tax=Sphingobium sp. EP60837 TaxID=1855519 RepID=UPI0007DE0EB3|nr:hypothetical protein [Sphingobium sp. EP60837]ANI80322.1 hypothetical protein EP837_03944 [Sphingobium sp. EP60837]